MEHTTYVGIDVAKDHLDVHVRPTDEAFRVSYDDAGLGTLLTRLRTVPPATVVLEASGGYEVALTATLDPRAKGRPIVRESITLRPP